MRDLDPRGGEPAGAPPAISIIVPAFNAMRFIDACLDSVTAQSFADWECIVVDDGSQDGSADRVEGRGDGRFRVIRQGNAGVATARNRGLHAAKGGAILFLDADDLLHPSALERLVEGLRSDPSAVASYGPFRKILVDGTPYPGEKPLHGLSYPNGDVLEAMLRENFLANGGHVLIRRVIAFKAGGFNVRLRLSEDWEFWCRLALQGPFHYIGSSLEVMYFRIYVTSTSGGLAQDWSNHMPALLAVVSNGAFPSKLGRARWRKLSAEIEASHLWEAGRVNFTYRRFAQARTLMLSSLTKAPTAKRAALFVLAQLSQIAGRGLVSRLRFRDEDMTASF